MSGAVGPSEVASETGRAAGAPNTSHDLAARPSALPSSHPAVFDFRARAEMPWTRVGIFLACFLPLVIGSAAVFSRPGMVKLVGPLGRALPPALAVLCVLTFVSSMIFFIPRRSRRLFTEQVRGISAVADPSVAEAQILELARESFARAGSDGAVGVQQASRPNLHTAVAVALARAGLVGRVYRMAREPEKLPALPAPFDVPFEPTTLRDSSETFIELRGRRVTIRDRIRDFWQILTRQTSSGLIRWILGFLVILGVVALTVQFIVGVTLILLGRHVASAMPHLFGVIIIVVAFHTQRSRNDRWFIVPGGVIYLEKPRGSGWSVRYVRRSHSVLIYWSDTMQCAFGAADGYEVRRIVTPFEFELLLRAWLSTAPAPGDEIVATFAGNER